MVSPLAGVVMGGPGDNADRLAAVHRADDQGMEHRACLVETREAAQNLALEIKNDLRAEMPPARRHGAAR